MRRGSVIAALATLALACAPAGARAAIWRGTTSQDRPASVMTGGDGVVNRVRLSWRATLAAAVLVARHGTVVDRCAARALTWWSAPA